MCVVFGMLNVFFAMSLCLLFKLPIEFIDTQQWLQKLCTDIGGKQVRTYMIRGFVADVIGFKYNSTASLVQKSFYEGGSYITEMITLIS